MMTKKMTPEQAWEMYVGTQSMEEFVAYGVSMDDYVEELPSMFNNEDFTTEELETVKELLTEYINNRVEL